MTTATMEREVTEVQASCAHCNLPVPAGVDEGEGQAWFCCAGCRAVYAAVQGCGLGGYYKLRGEETLVPAGVDAGGLEAMDSAAFAKLYVVEHGDGTRSVDLFLEGVTCGACVWLVEKLPEVVEGVVEARLSLRRATVRVTWDAGRVKLSKVAKALQRFGYSPHAARGVGREEVYRRELRGRIVKLGVAGALMGNLMLLGAAMYAGWGGMEEGVRSMLRWVSMGLGVTALAWPGGEFFRSAWAAVRTRSINLDVPIVVALAAGGVAGVVNVGLGRGEIYFDSLAALVFLLLVGRFLQFKHQRKNQDALELLFSMTPATCRVVDEVTDEVREVPVEAVGVGDVVEVRAGGVVPADGVVVSGASTVSEALLTGETLPVGVRAGSAVYGSSANGAGVLRVRVTEVGEGSRVGRLMRLLDLGLAEKPEIVRFGDKVGRWFVGGVTLAAAGTFAYWARYDVSAAMDHAVAMLIVTCPCVLGLATPMTISVAIGQLARRDVLVKSGGVLEKLARAGREGQRLMLDKTGTLTRGELEVVRYSGEPGLRGVVAALERRSGHPVARSLVRAFERCEVPAEMREAPVDVTEHQDGGISGRVGGRWVRVGSVAHMRRHGIETACGAFEQDKTCVLVAVDLVVRGSVVLRDTLRDGTQEALRDLRGMGFAAEILSGDAQAVVSAVGKELGIAVARGGVSPEEKLAAVREGPCVMVGDGINDAAALAAAGVGIAVHGGSEASLAAADVYIARPGLMPVVDLVRTARRMMRVIYGNFGVSLAYNVLAGVLAATGHMNPLVAAILMPLSSATVLSLAVMLMSRGGTGNATVSDGVASPSRAGLRPAPTGPAGVEEAVIQS